MAKFKGMNSTFLGPRTTRSCGNFEICLLKCVVYVQNITSAVAL